MNRIEELIDLIKDKHHDIRRDIKESQECQYILNKYKALLDHVETELKSLIPSGGRRKTTSRMRNKSRK